MENEVKKMCIRDRTSTVLTILLALIFLGEGVTPIKTAAMVLIMAGTWLMIEKKQSTAPSAAGHGWFWYAAGSAFFASLTSILGKIGVSDIGSNLGTAIRTTVVPVSYTHLAMFRTMVTDAINTKAWKIPLFSPLRSPSPQRMENSAPLPMHNPSTVSYTHLDVYKRQS